MAASLPFNSPLEMAAIPKVYEVKRSLFDSDTCEFLVVNYRDRTMHMIRVRVTRVSDRWPELTNQTFAAKEFELEGTILTIDGSEWGPPANKFVAQYVPDHPGASSFTIISSV